MLGTPKSAGVTIDRDVVRGIDEDRLRLLSTQKPLEGFRTPGIATQQSVAAQLPQITNPGDRRNRRIDVRDVVRLILLLVRA